VGRQGARPTRGRAGHVFDGWGGSGPPLPSGPPSRLVAVLGVAATAAAYGGGSGGAGAAAGGVEEQANEGGAPPADEGGHAVQGWRLGALGVGASGAGVAARVLGGELGFSLYYIGPGKVGWWAGGGLVSRIGWVGGQLVGWHRFELAWSGLLITYWKP